MKRFLVKISLFIILLFLVDRGLFVLLKWNRPADYKSFLQAKKVFFEKEFSSQLLIFGDSHISDALDSRTLENLTGLEAFNLAVYHSTPFDTYFMIREALDHLEVPPTYVVIGTNPEMFYKENTIGIYTPLIIGNKLEMILSCKEKFSSDVFFKSIREKKLFKHLLNKVLGKKYVPTREITDVYNGFLKFDNTLSLDSTDWKSNLAFDSSKVKEVQLKYFMKSIELLRSNQVKVFIVHPPIFNDINFRKTQHFNAFLRQKLRMRNIDLNLSTFPDKSYNNDYYANKKNFLNPTHLNNRGAQIFTQDFCNNFLPTEIGAVN